MLILRKKSIVEIFKEIIFFTSLMERGGAAVASLKQAIAPEGITKDKLTTTKNVSKTQTFSPRFSRQRSPPRSGSPVKGIGGSPKTLPKFRFTCCSATQPLILAYNDLNSAVRQFLVYNSSVDIIGDFPNKFTSLTPCFESYCTQTAGILSMKNRTTLTSTLLTATVANIRKLLADMVVSFNEISSSGMECHVRIINQHFLQLNKTLSSIKNKAKEDTFYNDTALLTIPGFRKSLTKLKDMAINIITNRTGEQEVDKYNDKMRAFCTKFNNYISKTLSSNCFTTTEKVRLKTSITTLLASTTEILDASQVLPAHVAEIDRCLKQFIALLEQVNAAVGFPQNQSADGTNDSGHKVSAVNVNNSKTKVRALASDESPSNEGSVQPQNQSEQAVAVEDSQVTSQSVDGEVAPESQVEQTNDVNQMKAAEDLAQQVEEQEEKPISGEPEPNVEGEAPPESQEEEKPSVDEPQQDAEGEAPQESQEEKPSVDEPQQDAEGEAPPESQEQEEALANEPEQNVEGDTPVEPQEEEKPSVEEPGVQQEENPSTDEPGDAVAEGEQ